MTPHLARNDESPEDLQNYQGTTAAASTSAASTIAAISVAATTTTATSDADPDNESVKEDHGDGEVGDADPVHDESAEEDHNISSNSYNWITRLCIPFSIPVPAGCHFSESVEFRGISGFRRNTR